jgi:lysophospholipase
MMGHSMGAALNLSTLIKGEPRIAGAFFTNPMLRIKTGRHSLWAVTFQTNWQLNHGRGTDYVPELFDDPFEHTFENDALTHDRARYNLWHEQLFACPHLAVGSPTWGWLAFALKIGETLLKDKNRVAKKVRTPITFLCSGDDHIIHKGPTKAFARKLGKAHYVEIAGSEHEVLIESDEYRRQMFQELDAQLDFVAPRGLTHSGAQDLANAEGLATSETLSDVAAHIGGAGLPEDGVNDAAEGLPEDEVATVGAKEERD